MGYSLCIVDIFGHFQNALIFRILAVFLSRFLAQNNFNVFVETFFACFRQFYFLTQTEQFIWAIDFALWPFLAIFEMLSFFEYKLFFQPFFAQNNFNVFVETFFACLRQFYFLTQTEYFVPAIAFALWPFVAIFKMLSFFQYQLVFLTVFCIEQV